MDGDAVTVEAPAAPGCWGGGGQRRPPASVIDAPIEGGRIELSTAPPERG
ncbi:MAG: hypothetical protein R3F43_10580 [bacterium]